MKKLLACLGLAVGLSACGVPEDTQKQQTAEAKQLILVNSYYRVINVDFARNRVGIALPGANPYHRQNWLKLDIGTKVFQRVLAPGGYATTRVLSPQSFMHAVRPGQVIWVHGGRDWDLQIVAKTIRF